MRWELLEAQRHLDEVLDLAHNEGPQVIFWNDEECVLLTKQEYLRLIAGTAKSFEIQGEQTDPETP
jgi:hypothetical protein